jgi:DNA polymerase III subunit delta'
MVWQTFEAIAGHGAQIDVLRRICASEQPSHAYLFEGPTGVGKQTVAWALAAHLACLEPSVDGPCGACRSCRSLQRGEHPDVSVLSRDGANIKISQVREALKRLRFDAVLGRAKVLLIEDADRLREEAANALLKTLEEPSEGTHFVLVTSKPQLLLDTIRSRVQALRFGPLPVQDVQALLVADGHDPGDASIAAALALGDLGRARALCNPDLLAVVDEVVRYVLELDRAAPSSAALFVEQHTARLASVDGSKGVRAKLDRERLAWTLDVVRAVLRDVMLAASGIAAETLPHARYKEGLAATSERVEAVAVARVLESIDGLEENLVYNPNPRIALEAQLVTAASLLNQHTL